MVVKLDKAFKNVYLLLINKPLQNAVALIEQFVISHIPVSWWGGLLFHGIWAKVCPVAEFNWEPNWG